jgi:tetratricopeptide (TPR) repeat protein
VYSGQHRFREAREAAERALARGPDDPWNYGMLGDALVELGEYDAAADAIQKMVELRPGVPSYTRAAYLRELFGDPDGAIEIMQMALSASARARNPQDQVWCRTQLGQLLFDRGRLAEAEEQYSRALELGPAYQPALTGLGRLRAAQQRFDEAIHAYRRSLEIAPTHDAAVELGDLLLFLGRSPEAEQPFALLDVIETLNRANQIEPDAQLALFYADHDRNLGEALAIAQRCAQQQPTIRSMDALAWSLYKNGRYAEALAASEQALRLGTQDAALHYHAGMIHARLGHTAQARAALGRALQIHPTFPPLRARETQLALDELAKRPPLDS